MQNTILTELEQQLENTYTLAELEDVKRTFIGQKGKLKELFKMMPTLAIEERKTYGQEINKLQESIKARVNQKETTLQSDFIEQQLLLDKEELPLNLKKVGHLHPITNTIRMMNKVFTDMGYSIMEGPEIETDEYCFQRLNVPLDHPARDMQDTIYIKEPEVLLRTQTSSIEARVLEMYKPPFKVVIPGKAYRNEKVNKSNHFVFHQYQGIVVLEKVSLKDLFGTFTYLFQQLYGENVVVRYRNKYYPEVEPGVGPDMQCFNCHGKGCRLCKNVGWIEMGGAGMIHPKVMKMAGIDTSKWMGFAFGLGLDRWVMTKYKITDIRTLTGGDLTYKYYEHENLI